MFKSISPKLPMRSKTLTKEFYIHILGFSEFGSNDFEGYLMVEKDEMQIHFFEYKNINPKENYGQVYIRLNDIEQWYDFIKKQGINSTKLELKPWKQKEFSILDPDNNLLTFGENI